MPILAAEASLTCSCVPSTDPLFDLEDLKAGVHINASECKCNQSTQG